MSASALLNSCASHNFIAAPQATKSSSSFYKSLVYPDELIEVHFLDNSSIISHQIVHLPLRFADGAVHTVEFQVVPPLNHAIILGMHFLHRLIPSVDFLNHTITW